MLLLSESNYSLQIKKWIKAYWCVKYYGKYKRVKHDFWPYVSEIINLLMKKHLKKQAHLQWE